VIIVEESSIKERCFIADDAVILVSAKIAK